MIVLNERLAGSLPDAERVIGYQGENDVETREFSLPPAFSGWAVRLKLKNSDGESDIVLLEPVLDGERLKYTWTIERKHVAAPGRLTGFIEATSGAKEMHSGFFHFHVSESFDAVVGEDVSLSELKQCEQKMDAAVANTEAARDIAIANAEASETSKAAAALSETSAKLSEEAAKFSETNAKESEDQAKTSETKAEGSEAAATQAYADLIAMIGTDIATLTDGKLTPAQIPDISINESFLIAAESELVGLNAQTGDMAYMETAGEVTSLYWLVGENKRENWKQLGLSFVANAGHSNTSDTAESANKINNHRLVEMTSEEFEVAVKDPDTYYLVG